MKSFFVLLASVVGFCHCGVTVPASTTLVKQSTTITHPSTAVTYSSFAPLPIAYSAPFAYSHLAAPSIYSHSVFAPSYYTPSPVFAQQIFAQYPGAVQYPAAVGAQGPAPAGQPAIEVADSDASPVPPAVQPPQAPPQAPQPSPVGAATPGNALDDDTVSVESA